MHHHTFLWTRFRNILRKWQQSQGKTTFLLTSRKTENATSACELIQQKPLAGDALAKLHHEQQNVVIWWRQITGSSMRKVNQTEKNFLKFLEPSHRPKVENRQLDGIWESMWSFIVESTHFNTSSIRDKWMKDGGLIQWNAIPICEMSKTSWQTRKHRTKDDLENHSKGQWYLLEQWLNSIIRLHQKISREFIKLARKYYLEFFLAMSWSRVELERRYFESRPGRFGKVGCIKYISSKNQRIGSVDQTKRWTADGTAKLSGRERIPSTQSKAGTYSEEWRSQWRWSPCRLLFDSRWLRLSSSCAEGRNIPYSTEIHWCYKVHSYWSGCVTRKEDWRFLECRFKRTFVRFLERIHEIHSAERKTSTWIHVVREETDRDPNDNQPRLCMASSVDENWWSRSESRKTGMGNRKTRTRQCPKTERNSLNWSRRRRIPRNLRKRNKKTGKTYGTSHAL